MDLATAGYARALADRPANTDVALRAYRGALASGDQALAIRAAAVLRTGADAPLDLPLLPLALAARDGDVMAANVAIARLDGGVLRILVPSLTAWTAFADGKDPFPVLDTATAEKAPVAARIALEQRGLFQIARGDEAKGLATVNAALAAGAPVDLRLAAAALLAQHDRDADARAVLGGDDAPVPADRIAGLAARPTLGFGVSRLLARVAGDLAGQGPSDLALALGRTALIADPSNDRAALLLADTLARTDATDAALATLDGVKASSPLADAAAAMRVSVLASAGREAEALTAARRVAERDRATPGDYRTYADRLLAADRYADAATWYAKIAAAAPRDWTAWLQYGGALDQAGDWRAARPALQRAVALAPAEPLALNYLGYAEVERGENVAQATRLLERASALKPDDPSITDSLGWAYYRRGEIARALPLIERAARAEPANAEIAEHLGDVYWTLGRRYEARYAWRAAAVTADSIDAPRLAEKIASGLPPRR